MLFKRLKKYVGRELIETSKSLRMKSKFESGLILMQRFTPSSVIMFSSVLQSISGKREDIAVLASRLMKRRNCPVAMQPQYYVEQLALETVDIICDVMEDVSAVESLDLAVLRGNVERVGAHWNDLMLPQSDIEDIVRSVEDALQILHFRTDNGCAVCDKLIGLQCECCDPLGRHAMSHEAKSFNQSILTEVKLVTGMVQQWIASGWRSNTLTKEEHNSVQASWNTIRKAIAVTSDVGQSFYDLLFVRYPSVIPLFEHTDMDAQAQHLSSILDLVISSQKPLPAFATELEELAIRHVGYGAQAAHYGAVGAVLLELLGTVLADKWTDRLKTSWTKLYSRISTVMIRAQNRNCSWSAYNEDMLKEMRFEYGLMVSNNKMSDVMDSLKQRFDRFRTFEHPPLILNRCVQYALKTSDLLELQNSLQSNVKVVNCQTAVPPTRIFDILCSRLDVIAADDDSDLGMVVFAPRPRYLGASPVDCWNEYLVSFAGYRQADGTVMGDRGNVHLTEAAIRLGWTPPAIQGRFDLLPIIFQTSDDEAFVMELPKHLVSTNIITTSIKSGDTNIIVKSPRRIVNLGLGLVAGGLVFDLVAITAPIHLEAWTNALVDRFDFHPELSYDIVQGLISQYHKLKVPTVTTQSMEMLSQQRRFQQLQQGREAKENIRFFKRLSPLIAMSDQLKLHAVKQEDVSGVVILYGSEKGTSATFAKELASGLRSSGCGQVACVSLNAFAQKSSLRSLLHASSVLFITSTYGKGCPPSNATYFWECLTELKESNSKLDGLKFSVFGLGSSAYASTFCAFAFSLNSTLIELGGTALAKIATGDELQNHATWYKWRKSIIEKLSTNHTRSRLSSSTDSVSFQFSGSPRKKSKRMPKLLRKSGKKRRGSVGNTIPGSDSGSSRPSLVLEIISSDAVLTDTMDMTDDGSVCSSQSDVSTRSPMKSRPLECQVVSNEQLVLKRQQDQAPKDVRSIVLEIPPEAGSDVYTAGDHVAITPVHAEEAVETLAQLLNANLNWYIDVKVDEDNIIEFKTPCQVRTVLSKMYELSLASPLFPLLQQIRPFAKSSRDKKLLDSAIHASKSIIFSKKSKADTARDPVFQFPTIVDLLKALPSVKMNLEQLLPLLRPVRPRYYSIGSSPRATPNQIMLTVGVQWLADPVNAKLLRRGACSSYLGGTQKGEIVEIRVKRSGFQPPANPKTPVIMISTGTGLAPFMGFIADRRARLNRGTGKKRLKSRSATSQSSEEIQIYRSNPAPELGKAMLVFGCRSPNFDDLYHTDLVDAVDEGVLSSLCYAWSRHGDKTYVQDVLKKQSDEVYTHLITDGGSVYFCGDSRVLHEVTEMLIQILMHHGHVGRGEAVELLQNLQETKRFMTDVWGVTLGAEYFRALSELKTIEEEKASAWLARKQTNGMESARTVAQEVQMRRKWLMEEGVSLEDVMIYLIRGFQDSANAVMSDLKAFLRGYWLVWSPFEVLSTTVEIMRGKKGGVMSNAGVKFLYFWMANYSSSDANSEFRKKLQTIVSSCKGEASIEWEDFTLHSPCSTDLCSFLSKMTPLLESSYSADAMQPARNIQDLRLSAEGLARNLAMMNRELYAAMTPSEFVRRGEKIHLDAASALFNRVAAQVSYHILSGRDVKVQATTAELFVQAAQKLKDEYHDLQGMHAIVSGLTQTAITRIKPLWEELSRRSIKILKKLNDLCSPLDNFYLMRNKMSLCEESRQDVTVPLSIILRDIAFVKDANPDVLSSGKTNLDKILQLGRLLETTIRPKISATPVQRDCPFVIWLQGPCPDFERQIDMSRELFPPANRTVIEDINLDDLLQSWNTTTTCDDTSDLESVMSEFSDSNGSADDYAWLL